LGVTPAQIYVECTALMGLRRRSEGKGAFTVRFTIKTGSNSEAETIMGKLKDQAVVDQIGQQIARDTGATIEPIKTIGEITLTKDPCAIQPGEKQANGKPCTATCCREKGFCVYNFDTKQCIEAPNDPCLKDDQGEVCLSLCCDSKPAGLKCAFNKIMRQCMSTAGPDPCTIVPGFRLPNGNECKQECCIRRNLEGQGCIWHHTAKTCTLPRPNDPCVDESEGVPCLGPCCKAKTPQCSWNPHSRQCLTPA